MKAIKDVQKKAFLFALQHLKNDDETIALTSIILMFMSAVYDLENQAKFHEELIFFEKRRTKETDIKNINLLIQYINIYKAYEDVEPKGVSDFVTEYYSILLRENIDAQLMPSFLLLKNLNEQRDDVIKEEVSLQIHTNFLDISNDDISEYINKIVLQTSMGKFSPVNVSHELISILEISLIEACRSNSIEKIGSLLKVLSYLKAPKSLAINTALSFLKYNQSTKGYIGYYEKDFFLISEEKKVNTILIQLSSTLYAINGLVAYELDFNISKLIHLDQIQNYEMDFV